MYCPDCHIECEEHYDYEECPDCGAQYEIDTDDDPEPYEPDKDRRE